MSEAFSNRMSPQTIAVWKGKFLLLIKSVPWESIDRIAMSSAVVLVAITSNQKLVLTGHLRGVN